MSSAIEDCYQIRKNGFKYVYQGLCDGRPTKWVTKSKWDFKISIRFDKDKGEVVYSDSTGKPILVFEDDEEEWDEW